MTNSTITALKNELFSGEPTTVFAIVDGATVTGLTRYLASFQPRHVCLYAGELAPDMAEVAPRLALLERDAPFTDWLLGNGWGRGWGIYGKTGSRFTELRCHFRRLAKVADEATGRPLYFRFYDPKLLAIYLSGCSRKELRECFGPVQQYLVEDVVLGSLARMQLVDDELRKESVSLG
ncbi:hypothetical protein GEOBRER4_n1214 [Citrifermentans bremense]|uniref:DUF4123 domain-containing protein n=1 Tax=Citrifermentans bremense TaxID=60035 RepID=A0A6S6LYP5_9BACT|nr:DUF4123 domain-containing protein [Citrifermentans bremense]BCG46418.1 hypothetical protein GEOBRER4_n1214 [Citrifermentans bremense]